jgi:predicted PurR-regulated permease PerM
MTPNDGSGPLDHPGVEEAPDTTPRSPRWNMPTKFLVALAALALIGGFLIYFSGLIGPVLACFILTYLLSPLVGWANRVLRMSWGGSAALVYALVVLVFLAVIAGAGLAIQQQVAGLVLQVIDIARDLPEQLPTLLATTWAIGPFTFNLGESDLLPLAQQALSAVQPVISQTGSIAGNAATSTVVAIGWTLFVLLVSFYIMLDFRRLTPSIERSVPGDYVYDVRNLLEQLGPIWNAYLRGQVTLSLIIGAMVSIAMTILGVQFGPVLGLVSFIAEFIPYIGPTLAALIGTLIALFQGGNYWGLQPWIFALIVLGTYIILQQIQGNLFYPRVMGGNLGLHPATILIGAIVMAQLLGFVGLILAAPLLATFKLFGGYVYAKLFDLDPFPPTNPVSVAAPADQPISDRVRRWLTPLLKLRRR